MSILEHEAAGKGGAPEASFGSNNSSTNSTLAVGQQLICIAIDAIHVGERLRRLDLARLKVIIDSISEIGLLMPITVTKAGGHYRLVAGLHRLAACRHLGHKETAAVVVEIDDVTRQIAEIDENMARAELTAAQTSLHLKRRKELFDIKGGATRNTPGGEQKIGFAKDTAEKTGLDKSTVSRAIARAQAIPDIQRLVNTSLDKGVELDALAKLPEAKQSALIEAATAGKNVRARSPKSRAVKPEVNKAIPDAEDRLESAQDDRLLLQHRPGNQPALTAIIDAYNAASGDAQDQFHLRLGDDDAVSFTNYMESIPVVQLPEVFWAMREVLIGAIRRGLLPKSVRHHLLEEIGKDIAEAVGRSPLPQGRRDVDVEQHPEPAIAVEGGDR
jgi:ParB-like chromosome segregation protein Spo0J